MPIQLDSLVSFGSPVCHSNGDFARNLRRLADIVEHVDHPTLRHVMVLQLDDKGYVNRDSYGDPTFTSLNAVALLEWAKLQIFDQTP
jgi:hypothetical protein